ncbi:carbohydrate ABC transporter substrate-binding protein [Actinobacteria bacterium YIM 96077]|uniref:Probable sugar-binding periplasmic protein n=1 Tax=Phytoactinopolyspora halophila TaxID=1981511 RepID=A0A329QG33_9ACTN|nr:ABC transporter substrate-binding protein [Phytoactinopolyspora halophila]AYY12450.1 carbohydrate ABC transporter substrate-binding protein [Actinobacteria bacterium YIM 96077]RAW09268.1 sugar ABC transporter substrate-binding protein [Phytoactinopolyspora halophila]
MSKRLRWMAPVVGAVLVLAACGESEDPRDEPEDPAGEADADDGDQEQVELLIESWRNDDLAVWEDVILPAFHEEHPNIQVTFQPTAPDEYDAALEAKLEGGTAGDLITCRPFDVSLDLFESGHLESLNDLPGIDEYGDVARSAWVTDDNSDIFCVPMASVIHGFIYNAEIFEELGLSEPETEEEFHALLDEIAAHGEYAPLVMGTADQWEAATMGFQNIGPNYWKGEEGRQALIDGEEQLDDEQYVSVFEELATWSEYLPSGYESVTYPDSQNMFTLGQGAIFPAGSWEIGLFREQADFDMGAFPPPPPEGQDTCYISDHTDIGIGMNTATEHPEETRTFLEWVTTAEFADLYANSLPGFFPLSEHEVELEDPLAQEFLDWRDQCEQTIRNSYQILSRGEPNLENELWDLSAQVLNGTIEPQEAAERAQDGLERWYEPHQ